MTRADLERTAQESVCACWHFDLANQMEETIDADLKAVINDPQHFHRENHRHNPVDEDEYRKELAACPEWRS